MKTKKIIWIIVVLVCSAMIVSAIDNPKEVGAGKDQMVAGLCIASSSPPGTPAYACDEQFTKADDEDYCGLDEIKVNFGCSYVELGGKHVTCSLPNGGKGILCKCVYTCKDA